MKTENRNQLMKNKTYPIRKADITHCKSTWEEQIKVLSGNGCRDIFVSLSQHLNKCIPLKNGRKIIQACSSTNLKFFFAFLMH